MLRSSCVRAAAGRPARAGSESRSRTRDRSLARCLSLSLKQLEPFVERALHVGILPLDDRLSAQLLEILLELALPLLLEDAIADLLARLVEGQRARRRHRLELQ